MPMMVRDRYWADTRIKNKSFPAYCSSDRRETVFSLHTLCPQRLFRSRIAGTATPMLRAGCQSSLLGEQRYFTWYTNTGWNITDQATKPRYFAEIIICKDKVGLFSQFNPTTGLYIVKMREPPHIQYQSEDWELLKSYLNFHPEAHHVFKGRGVAVWENNYIVFLTWECVKFQSFYLRYTRVASRRLETVIRVEG